MERRFRYIVLPADRLDRTITVGLPQDADDLLGTYVVSVSSDYSFAGKK